MLKPTWAEVKALPLPDVFECCLRLFLSKGNKNTHTARLQAYKAFDACVSETTIEALTLDNMLLFERKQMSRGLSPSSISTHLSHLKAAARVLRDQYPEWLTDAHLIKVEQITNLDPQGLTHEQQEKVLAVASEDVRKHFIFRLLIHTGLRQMEACNLKLKQVQGSYFVDVLGKGKRRDQIFINSKLRPVLDEYLEWREAEMCKKDCTYRKASKPQKGEYPLLISKWYAKSGDCGWAMSSTTLFRIVRGVVVEALGLEGQDLAHPHSLRHTFAYNLINAGVPIDQVSRLMRHKSIETTMIYLRRRQSEMEAAAERA